MKKIAKQRGITIIERDFSISNVSDSVEFLSIENLLTNLMKNLICHK